MPMARREWAAVAEAVRVMCGVLVEARAGGESMLSRGGGREQYPLGGSARWAAR
jgi:hypothetical protein